MEHLGYGLAWLSFGAGHSLLAGRRAKDLLHRALGAWYRLAYNLFAVLHLALVWTIGRWLLGDDPAFAMAAWMQGILLVVHLAGWLLMLVALGGYDLGRLAGSRQIRAQRLGIVEPEDEALRTDGCHRFVRHPLYTAAFLILWGAVDGPFQLATAAWGSLYLVIGTWLEERRLLQRYGQAYADYRARVPAFIPWKGLAR
jgi:protein-S-isoprenylcysteine O-methyltransferase Ste14